MALTAYSLCPGGTGKKLKFCCPGCLEELEKVNKFIDAEQYSACLNYIDSLLEKDAARACLLALRCRVLSQIPEKKEELFQTANHFFEVCPESPVAIAEWVCAQIIETHDRFMQDVSQLQEKGENHSVILLAHVQEQREKIRLWVSKMLQAIHMEPIMEQTADKMSLLVRVLIAAGMYESAFEWIRFLHASEHYRQDAQQQLSEIVANKEIPLCLRVMLSVREAPAGHVWTEPFNEVVLLMKSLGWEEAQNKLEKLEREYPEITKKSVYWYNRALLHEWKCEIQEARSCWENFLVAEDVNFEESLEIQTRLFALSQYPLDDAVNSYRITFTLTQTDEVKEALLSDPYVNMMTQELPPSPDGSVALAACEILDGEKFYTVTEFNEEEFSIEDIPVVIGNAILWARQTDKEPRLEIFNVLNQVQVTEHLKELLGKWIVGEPKVQTEMRVSVTFDSFSRELCLPRDTSRGKALELYEQHYRNLLLNRWIHFPLGVLGRQSMQKVAGDPAYYLKMEAVIQMLYFSLERNGMDKNMLVELRDKLSLPPLAEIPPEKVAETHPMFYDRVDIQKVPQNVFPRFFHKCMMYGLREKSLLTARFIVAHPELQESLRFQAATFLLRAHDRESELHSLASEARAFCEKQGIKHSTIDLLEMELYMEEGNQLELMKMVRHLQAEHMDDPEVIQTLLYLQQQARAAAERYTGGVSDGVMGEMSEMPSSRTAADTGSGLWTPDSAGQGKAPKEEGGGSSKLWLPD
ncbi:MAG: hypothetical protein Q4C96_03505 [Planctomycetia bacterium]|nr:hypothetical protein [Planctomycetia bacterium]